MNEEGFCDSCASCGHPLPIVLRPILFILPIHVNIPSPPVERDTTRPAWQARGASR